MKFLAQLVLVFVLSGCAGTLNQRNAHEYANAGRSAQLQGDWDAARRLWAKAAINARLGGMTDRQLAVAYYEYGRSLGATCFFDESEKYLKEALELDSKTGGPVHMALLELARLNLDQKKYPAAISYYEQLPNIYEELGAESRDPSGVAEIYAEYSQALSASGDKSKANQLKAKGQELASKANSPTNTERTPYGKHCK